MAKLHSYLPDKEAESLKRRTDGARTPGQFRDSADHRMKVLDSDIGTHLLNAREPELLQRFGTHSPPDLAICSVVRAELLWGARNSDRAE